MAVGERSLVTCEHDFAGPRDGHPKTTLDLRLISNVGNGIGFTPREVECLLFMVGIMALGLLLFLWREGVFAF